MADSVIVQRLLEFGYSRRDADLYANIHTLTEGGTKGIKAFELGQWRSLGAILPPGRENHDERLDLQRMFTEPLYRQDYFGSYMREVLPKLKREAAPPRRSLVERIASLVR